MLPIETNKNIRSMLMNTVAQGGLSFVIPYPQAFKNNNKGTSQTISIQFDQTLGKHLQKVIHSVFNLQEDYDTAYDHSNNNVISGVDNYLVNQKVLSYYTMLNGKRQQDLTERITEVYILLPFCPFQIKLQDLLIDNSIHAIDKCEVSRRKQENTIQE